MDRLSVTTPRARIACISRNERALEALTATFKNAGYVLSEPGVGAADLCLVDLRGQTVSVKKAQKLASTLKRRSAEASIFFLTDPALDGRGRTILRRFGEVIPAAQSYEHLLERCRQMVRLRNIAEEAGERMKTLASLNKLVEFPPVSTSNKPLDILIAGAPGPAASICINAVSHIAENYACVLTAGQALRSLEHHDFDAAVFLPTGDNDPLLSVTRAMRRNANHAGVPIIHLVENEQDLPPLARQGVNEFILQRHAADDLGVKIQVAVRRRRLLHSMHNFLQACTGDRIRDKASGAFTSSFLSEHGARLCARADQTTRSLSATLVHLSANSTDEPTTERKALHQAARLMNRVTRAEDLTVRIGPETFIILSPATSKQDAEAIALRIDGVLTNTVFRNRQDETPYSVSVKTAVYERRQGEAIEEVVANALKVKQNKDRVRPPRRQSP